MQVALRPMSTRAALQAVCLVLTWYLLSTLLSLFNKQLLGRKCALWSAHFAAVTSYRVSF